MMDIWILYFQMVELMKIPIYIGEKVLGRILLKQNFLRKGLEVVLL
ncbi:hypothetical protein OMAG_001955 [Candidatus Omnitrophus magneticus]|uniref:Uncharacterized protein n=1 Tax=Candidatus Omnitrophus magneticus TaxID=1609969 RepID=A0A0F0CLS2_9BACT|nr:hypothetical protein OMAG_001955 [Candidatus Omnitrophus magneticus]